MLSGEVNIEGFNVYSESACQMKCLARKQMGWCKCKHHLLRSSGMENQGTSCFVEEISKKKFFRART